MVVDYLRRCYSSTWQLFRDSEATTRGRYYFAAPDARHFPVMHHFGSRHWFDKNYELIPGLGEDRHVRHVNYNGEFVGIRPSDVAVGNVGSSQAGYAISQKFNNDQLFNGYPEACYLPVAPQAPPQPRPLFHPQYTEASQLDRCIVHRLWTKVISYLYLDQSQEVIDLLRSFLGAEPTITVRGQAGNFPACVTVVQADYAIACMDGTRNAQQFALQAFQAIQGPIDQGGFSTVPLWNQAAQQIHGYLVADGVTDTRPVLLVGHSYGGCAALILAGKYKSGSPSRTIRYATYGLPKIGDKRLLDMVRGVYGVNLVNDNDVVTVLPPDPVTMAAIAPLFPAVAFVPWYQWERAPNVMSQNVDGELSEGNGLLLDFTTMFALASNAVSSSEQAAILGHSIEEYNRRVTLRCPERNWPVSEETFVLLNESIETDGGVLLSGGPGDFAGSGTILLDGGAVQPAMRGGLLFDSSVMAPVGAGGIFLGGL